MPVMIRYLDHWVTAALYKSRPSGIVVSDADFCGLDPGFDSRRRTATAGSDVVQSGRPIFDDFCQHL
ncbi:hypothetical protein TNCV_780191 [Trichonephila clavipes]|nr:hypothetical protein TNCV_780191 [Trichonephila clavipes]